MRAATVTTLLGVGLMAGALLAAIATSSGETREADRSRFERLDRDGDAAIARHEAAADAQVATRFADADQDGDGKLDWSEYRRTEEHAVSDS
jgi:Ca2+-binding EF-hand superfamily protein